MVREDINQRCLIKFRLSYVAVRVCSSLEEASNVWWLYRWRNKDNTMAVAAHVTVLALR